MSLWAKLTYPFRYGPRRPLAERQPTREEMGQRVRDVPLGMEATDLDAVNRVNRRNYALERATGATMFGRGQTEANGLDRADAHVTPMPDDETYATRFYRIFHKKGS